MKSPLASVAALSLCASAVVATAEDKWTEVRSPHFHVVGNSGASAARRIADRLEKFRAALGQIFPGQPLGDVVPTTVLLYKDEASLRPLFPWYQGKRVALGGIFVKGTDRSYMALNAEHGDEALRTVLHEYTHLLTSDLPLRLPLWVTEGLAELYSTAEVREKEVALGKPLPQHILLLRDRPLLPMEAFLTVDHSSPHYNERDKQGIFYAQSWALTHYLLVHGTSGGRRLRPFLEASAAGATGAEACRRAFGVEPAALQKELTSYVRRLAFRYHTVPVQPLATALLQEKVLEPHEGAFYTGDVLAHMNRLDEARPFLEKVIQRQPGYAPAYRAMGLGHAHAQDHAAAVRWFNSAVEHDPQDDLARYYRGRSRALAAGSSFGPAGAATVRDDFKAGVRALPHSPEAWQFLAYADSVLGRRDDEALGVLRQALRLAPDRDDLWQRLVRTHLARDEVPEAQRLAGILRARAATPEEKKAANELLMLVNAARQPRMDAGMPPEAQAASTEATAPDDGAPQRERAGPAPPLDDPRAARAQGVIEHMDCQPGGRLQFTLRSGARTLRLRAAAPDAFMLYRDGARVQLDWTCGPLSIPVEAAFLPDEGASTGTAVRFTLVGP